MRCFFIAFSAFIAVEKIFKRTGSFMRLRNIPGARDMIAASPWVVQKPEDHCGQWKSFFGDDQLYRH